jgi:hypothetical protein
MQANATKKKLYVAPVASTSFLDGANWDGATSSIRFTYRTEPKHKEESEVRKVSIHFRRAMLVVLRAESFSRVEHIQGCYDTLVEVEDSDWLEAERDSLARARMKESHHYAVYLDGPDGSPGIELIAESWSVEDTPCTSDLREVKA